MPPPSPSPSASNDPSLGEGLTEASRQNIQALAEEQEREEAQISRVQAAIERISQFFGSPAYLAFAVLFIVVWVTFNLWGDHAGWSHIDKPPFFWLQGLVSSNALLLTVAVLIRQNRMARLAARRAHLDLHVNLLTERKVSKVLELVEQLRQPLTGQQAGDAEASELAQAADPKAILSAIKNSENTP